MLRRFIGCCVAIAYAAIGSRRRVVRRLKTGLQLPVVVHAAPAWQLERILSWLKAHDVLERLVLSFDDGWQEVRDYITILEKYDVRAKVFIAPGETLRGNVWTDEAMQLGIPASIWRGWYGLGEEERNARLDIAHRESGVKVERRLLSKDEVCELAGHPLIDIENHTWSHLSATPRPAEEVVVEVKRAQETLTEWTGRTPVSLAWPFGRGNKALDVEIAKLCLAPVYTRQGYEFPFCRNMAIEGVSFQENLGRILGAWPKVGETL